MLTTILLVVGAFFTGHAWAPTEVQEVPVVVKVSVPVECRERVPDRPAMPTEAFAAKPPLDQWAKAADAEIEIREGYEAQLRQVAQTCTKPIKHPETHAETRSQETGDEIR